MSRRIRRIEIGLAVAGVVALLLVAIVLVRNSRRIPYADEVLRAAQSPDAVELLAKWGPAERTSRVEHGNPVQRLHWRIICRGGFVDATYDETREGNMVRRNNSVAVHPLYQPRSSLLDRIFRSVD